MNMVPAPLQPNTRRTELTARFMTAVTSDSNVAWRSRCRLDCSASSSICTAIPVSPRSDRGCCFSCCRVCRDGTGGIGELSLIQDQCGRTTGDGEEPQVLPVGGKLLPDLIKGADPGAGQ